MPPKSERDETLSALAARIFAVMIDDVILDAALQAHHEVARSRTVCQICNTRCSSVHTPGNGNLNAPPSLADTPINASQGGTEVKNGTGSGTGSNTPNNSVQNLECVSCSRPIAPSRYAPHLSSCMGLSTARRGAVRGNLKSKQSSDAGRSASPASEVGNGSDERIPPKGKSKSKVKRSDESSFSLKRKRPASPQTSPSKKAKGKANGSPVSRVKAEPDASLPTHSHYSPSTGSQSKVPSKLRDSSTASFLERSATPSSRSSTSPAASSHSAQSPTLAAASMAKHKQSPSLSAAAHGLTSAGAPGRAGNGNGHGGNGVGNGNARTAAVRGRATGTGPPRRLSPPRALPIHVPDYTIDVEGGDETGSSTDTDSS